MPGRGDVVYVYALVAPVRAGRCERRTGIGRQPLALVTTGAIGALVSRVPTPPEPAVGTLRTHDAVVRAAWAAWPAVLPVRFGTTMNDEKSVRAAIREREERLNTALSHVRGCAQMTIRLLGTPSVDRAKMTSSPGSRGAGTAYLKLVAAIDAESKRLPQFDPVRTAISRYVREERIEAHTKPPLVASVFHLIAREQSRAYTKAAASSAEAAHLRTTISGPLPAYAFASIEL
jgi:hypothetical protein